MDIQAHQEGQAVHIGVQLALTTISAPSQQYDAASGKKNQRTLVIVQGVS